MDRLWSPAEIAMLGRRGEQAGLATAAGATSFSTGAGGSGGSPPRVAGGPADPAYYDLVVEAAGATAAGPTALAKIPRGGAGLLLRLPPPRGRTPLARADGGHQEAH